MEGLKIKEAGIKIDVNVKLERFGTKRSKRAPDQVEAVAQHEAKKLAAKGFVQEECIDSSCIRI